MRVGDDFMEDKLADKFLNYISDNFGEIREEFKKHVIIQKKECSIHGMVEHSCCDLTGVAICLECLKNRRFFVKK
jgi:hypothetical protein